MLAAIRSWWRDRKSPRDPYFAERQSRSFGRYLVVEMSASDREQLFDLAHGIHDQRDELTERQLVSQWTALRMQALAVSLRRNNGSMPFDPLNAADLLALRALPDSLLSQMCDAVADLSAMPFMASEPAGDSHPK